MNPLFLLRLATLLTSAAANLIVADPQGFADKLAERIRLAEGPAFRIPTGWLRRIASGRNSKARELIDAGRLTEGVRVVAEEGPAASAGDIHLAKRTLERIEQLEMDPAVAKRVTPATGGRQHRVLHVLTNSKPFTASGYTVRSHQVLKCQREIGMDARAVTRLGYPVLVGKLPTSPQQTIDGVDYRRLLPWMYPSTLTGRTERAIRLVVEMAREMNATILHTTTDYTNALVVAEAARQLGVPWVYEIRGELESTWLSRQPKERQREAESSDFYRMARVQEATCAASASAVVTLSEISRDQLISRGVAAERITVIPNAIESESIGRTFDQQEIRRELRLPSGPLYGSVTSVVDYEGLDTLIRALKHLPDDARALIVGDGAARPGLERLAKEEGVADRTIFAGRQPQESIWRWYAALDAFVVPRRDIPVSRTVTPLKPLEAQALSIPVVASDLPALREVTGELAQYVTPDDPEALADALNSLDHAESNQDDITEWLAGRTWSANAERYRAMYESLVAR